MTNNFSSSRLVAAPLSARGRHSLLVGCIALLVVLAAAPVTQAQRSGQKIEEFDGVKLEQKLGESVPKDLTFKNAQGQPVRLGQYLDGERPVILSLVYHECPMLCNLMVQGLTRMLGEMAWTPGGQFEVLTVSFNKREGPALARKKKKAAVGTLGKPEAAAGWHFLTGSEKSIQSLTQAVGFNFNWIAEQQEFAHPSTVIFLSGDGKITRYLGGVSPDPGDARKALVEASNGQVGNVFDQVVARCFQYDPKANSYVADAFNIMRLGSLLFAALVGVGLLIFWRRENGRQEAVSDNAEAQEGAKGGSDQWRAAWNEA